MSPSRETSKGDARWEFSVGRGSSSGVSFALYIGIAFWAQAKSTGDFYVAEKSIHPVLNGMATGADWMSAASFISMAGLISFMGRDGSMYLMGWTGGYVLLAVLLAPYLRKYGKFTVPQFVGERYYSNTARVVALLCAIFVSFTYVAGQMRGVGIVFSRFLETSINMGVVAGMALVFFYATLGGMKGITYTQVAQYCVLIVAYMVPAIFISIMLTGNPIPQLGYGRAVSTGGAGILGVPAGTYLLDVLEGVQKDLGLPGLHEGREELVDVFIDHVRAHGRHRRPAAHHHPLLHGPEDPRRAGLRRLGAPLHRHPLYDRPGDRGVRQTNFIKTINNKPYSRRRSWFKNWEKTKLVGWQRQERRRHHAVRAG